mmetsp:Transcript_9372/g.26765  ORF Transcript_9372/g.26765 Transcript_9372/m.26765 type:complete len:633 (+) Transcript_9372:184-2082(+)|eukprot:CAMPEP_0117650564 /NCGR_PEP_ID=MMETSP0804-20121206/1607_1 /TAXON_ID=1074897 /ORGANISM="Tetraselmis astigmatica, Strain CCMP880" /LENGTH=632 /DNA_ID=CAMNT_0005456445 /DNA_START=119 /DNA_END=2017 /DNA_ORIENTATION=+
MGLKRRRAPAAPEGRLIVAKPATCRPHGRRRALGDQLLSGSRAAASGQRLPDGEEGTEDGPSVCAAGQNLYKGFKSAAGAVDRVHIKGITPLTFWKKYVCPRRPVVIVGHPDDPAWKASHKWTDEYLTHQAGHCQLRIEARQDACETYGRDKKRPMLFKEFVSEVAKGNPLLYLTTQEVSAAPDGFPRLHAEPISSLIGDLPLRPGLLGSLVPQSINLWMGCSPKGSSSGLHHDFHDNLYVLLRGSKKFRMYSPDQAGRMYTNGQLRLVHPNGRIVYAGDGDIRADGADALDASAWEARHRVEARLQQLGRNGKGVEGPGEDESAMDAALDEMLAGALEAGDDGCLFADDDYIDSGDEEGGTPEGLKQDQPAEPPSFSLVDLRKEDRQLQAEFPLFPGKSSAAVAEVQAGEMLYLPAGWFHEVTSTGGRDSGGHLALNFWMHPPDNLDPSLGGMTAPYCNPLWPALWEKRRTKCSDASCGGSSAAGPSLQDQPITEVKGVPAAAGSTAQKRAPVSSRASAPRRVKSEKQELKQPKLPKMARSAPKSNDGTGKHMCSTTPTTVGASFKPAKKRHLEGSFGDVGSWFVSASGSDGCNAGFGVEDSQLDRLMAPTLRKEKRSKGRKKQNPGRADI